MSAPDLSIVIVSYNTRELLDQCLDALPAATAGLAVQTIVVDNASRDGTVDALRARRPEVEVLALDENAGFARGTNLGIARSTGRTVCWLNPDCVATPGSLTALVRHADAHPEAGAIGPRLVYANGEIQPSALAFPGGRWLVAHLLGLKRVLRVPGVEFAARKVAPGLGRVSAAYLASRLPAGESRSVDWVSGACLLARAEVAAAVGPIDEGYFMYCEDADWCHRVHAAGWQVHQVPGVTVVHHVGGSGGGGASTTFHFYSSLLRYFRRHRPASYGWIRLVMVVTFLLRAVGQDVARLFGARADRPWWRLARHCWAAGGAGAAA